MGNPIVSVVMITYNHEKYIKEAIEGVLMQECNFEVELIIANDNSPDYTDAEVQNILNNHPHAEWIRYIKRDNNFGMMPNFIDALKQSKGKYIALCEGDDYWTDPLKLQKQVEVLESNPEIIACFTNAEYRNEIIDKKHLYVQHLKEGIVHTDTIIQFGGSLYPTASLMFHKARLNLEHFILLKDDFSGGDELLIYLLMKEGKIYFIDQITCIYRRWIGGVYSSIINNSSAIVESKKQNINGYKKFNRFSEYKFKKPIKRKISSNCIYILKNDEGFSRLKYIFHLHYKDFFKLIFRL